MNPGMKMLMLTSARNGSSGNRDNARSERDTSTYGGRNYPRSEYESRRENYGMNEMRSGNYDANTMEMRRRRDSRGRFLPKSYAEMGGDNYSEMAYVPPVYAPSYEDGNRMRGESRRSMNRIGFALEGEEWRPNEINHRYAATADFKRNGEMGRTSSPMEKGYAKTTGGEMTHDEAMEWTGSMENADGSYGAHWNTEQVKQVMAQKNIPGNPVEFFVALNMMYSDYCKVAKKLNVNNIDFYVEMARAFLEDPDAESGKLKNYYECCVKRT